MKTAQKNANDDKLITVTVNPALDKYSNQILFPEKLAKAKEQLKNAKLPGKKA